MDNNITLSSTNIIAMVDDNIVDYQAANRFIKKSKLQNELVHFISGEEFIAYLKEHKDNITKIPALVLMDINMPGLNGHQTTALIKSMPEFNTIPIIYMLTSSTDIADQEAFKKTEATGFMIKPFTPDGYIDLFNSFLP